MLRAAGGAGAARGAPAGVRTGCPAAALPDGPRAGPRRGRAGLGSGSEETRSAWKAALPRRVRTGAGSRCPSARGVRPLGSPVRAGARRLGPSCPLRCPLRSRDAACAGRPGRAPRTAATEPRVKAKFLLPRGRNSIFMYEGCDLSKGSTATYAFILKMQSCSF